MTNDSQQTLLHMMQPPGGRRERVQPILVKLDPFIFFFRGRKKKAGQRKRVRREKYM